MKVINSEDVIEYLLCTPRLNDESDDNNNSTALFIESSYLTKWREWITKRLGDDCYTDMGPFKLRIIENIYDVHLVVIARMNARLLLDYFGLSFQWDDYGAIFTDLESFSGLKKIIRQNKLEKCVKLIQTWPGINLHNKTLKIVTFRQTVNWLMENIHSLFLFAKLKPQCGSMYQALPWFHPSILPLFDKQSVNDEFFVGLITFLHCQRELCYDMKSEFTLNVFELCALKLAFCPEFGIESRACTELSHEINDLIIDSLNRFTQDSSEDSYFRDNHFNLIQYATDRNYDLYTQDLACLYFIYNFQDWIKSITIPSQYLERNGYLIINLVKGHTFVLSQLSKLPNVRFNIDGTGFSDMDFKLFFGILKTGNVAEITLDTQYKWVNTNEPKYMSTNVKNRTYIRLIGNNKFNFIEDCIECLKLIKFRDSFDLEFINPNIKSFVIFENLHVDRITFVNLTLTSSILRELIACELTQTTRIDFKNCRIVDGVEPWTLLINELKYCQEAVIIEEENTWQYLFDSIVNQMRESNSNEFTFEKELQVETQTERIIELKRLKFTIIEFESRLEIRDRDTNETLDLFDLKNEIKVIFREVDNEDSDKTREEDSEEDSEENDNEKVDSEEADSEDDSEEEDSEDDSEDLDAKEDSEEYDSEKEEDSVEKDNDEEGRVKPGNFRRQSKRILSLIQKIEPITKRNKLN